MASGDEDAAGLRSADEERGSTSATDCSMVRETLLHWDLAKYRRSYSSTLDTRYFWAMFIDGRNSTMFDRLRVRCDTGIGVWIRRRARTTQ